MLDVGLLRAVSPTAVRPAGLHRARLAAAQAAGSLGPVACGTLLAALSDIEDEAFRWGLVAGALAVSEAARSRDEVGRVVLRAAELVEQWEPPPVVDIVDLTSGAAPAAQGEEWA